MIHTRRYVPSDWPAVIAMARAFHAESPVHRHMPFSDARVHATLDACRSAPDWLALLAEDDDGRLTGFALVTVQAPYFSDALELLELAIFVDPGRRGARTFLALMERIEGWAKDLGAVQGALGINTGIDHERAIRSFLHAGYVPCGVQVQKRYG
jgi:GNAT superfamily N-acetyltransferase